MINLGRVIVVEPNITPEENERNLDELKGALKIIISEWTQEQFQELEKLNNLFNKRKKD